MSTIFGVSFTQRLRPAHFVPRILDGWADVFFSLFFFVVDKIGATYVCWEFPCKETHPNITWDIENHSHLTRYVLETLIVGLHSQNTSIIAPEQELVQDEVSFLGPWPSGRPPP